MPNDLDLISDVLPGQLPNADLLTLAPADMAPANGEDAPVLRYGFSVGDLGFLIPQGVITEVLDSPQVFPLPRAPRWLAGMINRRGNVTPLFELRRLPGVAEPECAAPRVLVIGQGAEAVAVYVDGLPRPLEVADSADADSDLPGLLQAHTAYAFTDRGVRWYEFRFREFFRHLTSCRADDDEPCD